MESLPCMHFFLENLMQCVTYNLLFRLLKKSLYSILFSLTLLQSLSHRSRVIFFSIHQFYLSRYFLSVIQLSDVELYRSKLKFGMQVIWKGTIPRETDKELSSRSNKKDATEKQKYSCKYIITGEVPESSFSLLPRRNSGWKVKPQCFPKKELHLLII